MLETLFRFNFEHNVLKWDHVGNSESVLKYIII